MIITIDGPAGAGKSTVARLLAERIGYRHLDTGAMYRAVTLEALETGLDPAAVAESDSWRRWLEDPRLRAAEVDARVPAVATVPPVRAALRLAQREFLARGDAVAEGRDIGRVVWPEAEIKIWLDADPRVRALRRGGDVSGRDARDATQSVSADDAIVVDTTGLTVDEVVDRLVGLVGERT